MSPKLQKRSALKLVGRTIPEAKRNGIVISFEEQLATIEALVELSPKRSGEG